MRYRQLSADIVPIKLSYFESGAGRLEPGEKYSGLYGKFDISSHLHNIQLKCSTHDCFKVLFHSMWSKYVNSKNIHFMTSSLMTSI